jgi:hypothetical protein
MTILKHISPASAFKVGAIAYGVLGFLLGALCTAVAVAGVHVAHHGPMLIASRVGVFAIMLCPIIYGIMGGIAAAIAALIYNLAATWVGGIEVEIANV